MKPKLKLITVAMFTTGKALKCLEWSWIFHCVSKCIECIRTDITRYTNIVLKEKGKLGVYRTTHNGRTNCFNIHIAIFATCCDWFSFIVKWLLTSLLCCKLQMIFKKIFYNISLKMVLKTPSVHVYKKPFTVNLSWCIGRMPIINKHIR